MNLIALRCQNKNQYTNDPTKKYPKVYMFSTVSFDKIK